MTQQISSLRHSSRDGRLDVLRGLCLINMVIVHLIEQGMVLPWLIDEVVMHWLRFAAGGFILTSGLCIGAIHYQKALDPSRRSKTYLSLLRRAGLVLLIHYFATLLSLVLVPLNGYREYDTLTYVRDVLFFWTGYDLLLFYVVMLLVSPGLIEAIRRFGVAIVGLISGSLFFLWYDNPYLPLYAIENHFPVIRWQAVFVCGVLIGSKLPTFDGLDRSLKVSWLVVSSGVALTIAGLSALERFGQLSLPWWLTVSKYPLSPLEVVRYLSLVIAMGVGLDLVWKSIATTRLVSVLKLIGVQSLLLWVVHVPLVANLASFHWTLAISESILAVWLAAWIGIWLSRKWADSLGPLPRLSVTAPVLGSLLIVGLLSHLQISPQLVNNTDINSSDPMSTPEELNPSNDRLDILFMDDDSIFETT